jgi:hypothetical protein
VPSCDTAKLVSIAEAAGGHSPVACDLSVSHSGDCVKIDGFSRRGFSVTQLPL